MSEKVQRQGGGEETADFFEDRLFASATSRLQLSLCCVELLC